MRTSSHKLMIEKGRYLKVPRNNRLCTKCSLGVVEDEEHALLVCPAHELIRNEIIDKVKDVCPNLGQLNTQNQVIYLLSAEGRVAVLAAELCYHALK